MKKLIFFLLLSSNVYAADSQILFVDFKHLVKPITLNEINKIHMNHECEIESKKCLATIKQKISAYKKESKDEKITKGHPASELCHFAGGSSLIYFDKDNNEYDYCKIGNYIINSWDVYYNLK